VVGARVEIVGNALVRRRTLHLRIPLVGDVFDVAFRTCTYSLTCTARTFCVVP
jgi:hypothetical protein